MTDRVYYYEDDNLKVMESTSRYGFALPFLKGQCVLDIGCGARRGPRIISKSNKRVIACDISKEAIQFCQRNYPSSRISYVVADAIRLPFGSEIFDDVLAFEVVEHLDNQLNFLKEAHRVLKKGGMCILSTPNRSVVSPQGVSDNPDHIHEFNFEGFRDFLRTDCHNF